KGELQVLRLDPAAHEIEILGKGQDTKGKGSASMKMTGKLHAIDGGTEVSSDAELNIVGILAQMGSRVINQVNDIMFEQFVNNFRQQLAGAGTGSADLPAAKPISAVGVAFSALKAAISGHGSETKPDPEKTKDDSNKK